MVKYHVPEGHIAILDIAGVLGAQTHEYDRRVNSAAIMRMIRNLQRTSPWEGEILQRKPQVIPEHELASFLTWLLAANGEQARTGSTLSSLQRIFGDISLTDLQAHILSHTKRR